MKKLFVILALALPILASAQKFGYVNTQELFQQMPELKQVEARLDSLNAQYENMLTAMQEEYQKKVQDYQDKQATMTDAIRQITEEEIYSIQQRLQTTYQTAQADVQKKQEEYLVPVQERMVNAIRKVGEEKGFTYIFNSATSLVYTGPDAIDVTDDVRKELGIK
ncbi:MAG: OmpH family outer membrane protein [Paludibacteraceae bacterium]|nr:OmpH family outer membrane protein [Paludibacteraceae bacterium]